MQEMGHTVGTDSVRPKHAHELFLEHRTEKVLLRHLNLFESSELLYVNGSGLHKVGWLMLESSCVDTTHEGFAQQFVVWLNFNRSEQVRIHDEESLRRSEAECNVLRLTWAQALPQLLLVANGNFLWRKAIKAIVAEKKQIARVQRLLDRLVGPIAPIDPVVDI